MKILLGLVFPLLFFSCPALAGGVIDGQPINAAVTNAAFLEKNANDTDPYVVTFSNATASTSTATGAIIVTGGVGIGGRLNTGGRYVCTDTTASTTTATGSIVTSGGVGVAGAINAGGNILGANLSGTNTGDVTLNPFGSSPNANGLSLSGQILNMQPADGTHPGGLSILAQTIAGLKTFSTSPNFSSLTASLPLQLDGSKNVISSAIDLSGSQATGTLAAGREPAHTGDVSNTAGSLNMTLATVNSNVGSFGGAAAIPTFTVNAKGLITAASTVAPTTTPTASTFAGWDANSNLSANNFIYGYTSTATAGATTTMTIASTMIQNWTGSSNQTIKLPTTSVVAGGQYLIMNNSTGTLTVQSSGANTILAIAAGFQGVFTSFVATPTTAANWNYAYSTINSTSGGSGTVTSVATGTGLTGGTITTTGTISMANMAAYTVKGNNTASTAAPSDLTLPNLQTFFIPPFPQVNAVAGTTTSYPAAAFLVTSANATLNAVYHDGASNTFTVKRTISAGTLLYAVTSGGVAPQASGTLTKDSGTGDSTITYQAVQMPKYCEVFLVGGGAGGGGSGNSGTSSQTGTAGNNSTFDNLTAGGGNAGSIANLVTQGGQGGSATVGSGWSDVGSVTGGSGGGNHDESSSGTASMAGGFGGNTPMFGGGGRSGYSTAGEAAVANLGGGGGGGGISNGVGSSQFTGSGGGSGALVWAISNSAPPAAGYTVVVASTASGGAGNTNGFAGGQGAAGRAIRKDFYQ